MAPPTRNTRPGTAAQKKRRARPVPLKKVLACPNNRLNVDYPLVVSVSGLKGGIGKSTSAMFIAFVFWAVYGKKVAVVDADPTSQTCWTWWYEAIQNNKQDRELAARGEIAEKDIREPLPFEVKSMANDLVGTQVRAMLDEDPSIEVVVIDCGGDSDSITASAAKISDICVVVTTPEKADGKRLPASAQVIAQANPDAVLKILFCKVWRARQAFNLDRMRQIDTKLRWAEFRLRAYASLRPRSYSADEVVGGLPLTLDEYPAIVTELLRAHDPDAVPDDPEPDPADVMAEIDDDPDDADELEEEA
ncbi:MAG: AAA family ATPase [Nocardiopsaceae bacterium]|nr:AAA family ATPase [Nocardiopsaceae bacterium]